MYIREGETKLDARYLCHRWSGKECSFDFFNIGGISKGVAVIFRGDCITNREVEISDIKIHRYKYPQKIIKRSKSEDANEREYFYAPVQEYKEDGVIKGFMLKFEDYEFFEGLNKEFASIKGEGYYRAQSLYTSNIRFTPTVLSGDVHEFAIYVVPLKYWENQAGGYVDVYKTEELARQKQQEEDQEWKNSFEYLKNHAQIITSMMPDSRKRGKGYIEYLQEMVSNTPEKWRDTPEYAAFVEELKNKIEERKGKNK